MDSFGRPQKFTANRKQELQLQKELKSIQDKALLDRYAVGTQQCDDAPKSSEKVRIRSSERKMSATKKIRKARDKQVSIQSQKESSPNKVVVDSLSNFKFAITSSLKTSVSVQQQSRKEPVPKLNSFQRVNKSTKQTRCNVACPSASQVQTLPSVTSRSTNTDRNIGVTPFQTDPEIVKEPPTGKNSFIGGSSEKSYMYQSSSSDLSLPSEPFDTNFRKSGRVKKPEAIDMDTTAPVARVTQASPGTLLLEVDMRFQLDEEYQVDNDTHQLATPLSSVRSESAGSLENDGSAIRTPIDNNHCNDACEQSTHSEMSHNTTLDLPPRGDSDSCSKDDRSQPTEHSLQGLLYPKGRSTPMSKTNEGSSHSIQDLDKSTTVELKEERESVFYSIGGSFSSFGHSSSLNESSRELSMSPRDEDFFSVPDGNNTRDVSQPTTPSKGSPPLPTLSFDQQVATSSWLKSTSNQKIGFDSKSPSTILSDTRAIDTEKEKSFSQTELTHSFAPSEPIASNVCTSSNTIEFKPVGTYESSQSESLTSRDIAFGHITEELAENEEDLNIHEDSNNLTNDQEFLEFLAFSDTPVTLEDVLHISGTKLSGKPGVTSPSDQLKSPKLTFLSTWNTSSSAASSSHAGIHHFCTDSLPQMPIHAQVLSIKSHTYNFQPENRYRESSVFSPNTIKSITEQNASIQETDKVLNKQKASLSNLPKSHGSILSNNITATAAKGKPQKELIINSGESTQTKVPQANQTDKDTACNFIVTGQSMEVARNPLNLLWTPAPPKLSLHPTTVQKHLFPSYKTGDITGKYDLQLARNLGNTQEMKPATTISQTKNKYSEQSRLHDPIFRSVPNFSEVRTELITQSMNRGTHIQQSENLSSDPNLPDKHEVHVNDDSPVLAQQPVVEESRHHSVKGHSVQCEGDKLHYSKSLPVLVPHGDVVKGPHVSVGKDFDAIMNEIEAQRQRLVQHHMDKAQKVDSSLSSEDLGALGETQNFEDSTFSTSGAFTSRKLQRQFMRGTKQGHSRGATTGRVRAIRRTKSAQMRTQRAREILSQPARLLSRRASFPLVDVEFRNVPYDSHQTNSQHHSSQSQFQSRASLPNLSGERFDQLMISQGAKPDIDDPYSWAYDIWWNKWFPEVLKECREAVAELYSGQYGNSTKFFPKIKHEEKERERVPEENSPKEEVKEDWANKFLELADIGPVWDHQSDSQEIKNCELEVFKLNQRIEQCQEKNIVALHYCRRGIMLRKLGRLTESLDDLNRAISIQPTFSDAYWHRHLLFLVQRDQKRALEDLSLLLKYNKKHYNAFRSKAALLLKKGDLSSAVYNMSQAIALHPNDSDSYFIRARMYEKRGEVESALSDYARVNEMEPSNIEALSRPAMHKFNKGMWAASIQHFSALLQRDPNNTEARIHRAKAHFYIGQYVDALQDLSAAIHLEPTGAQAFFHRGYLLRNSKPRQALRDFSVSLLLDDSATNVDAFIHRGVLYTQFNCYDEALSDFESAVRLKRTLPSPHVCAGLVYMLHRNNITRAIWCFSAAILVDGTCIRAYLCRASAYQRDAKYKLAILDYTRAIHLEPNNPNYYLLKGELYLKLGELDLASVHISIAAKLSTGFNQDKSQRALVDSFLGNHHQAIALLQALPKTPEVYSLLGRIQFKARDFIGSIDSLKKAIQLAEKAIKLPHMVTCVGSRGNSQSNPKKPDFKAITSYHFICGQSQVQSSNLREAISEFSNVIQAAPDHALAYYERGVTKLMDDNPKGMLDLNKSLALDSKLFQSFLARAAYYGKTGRFTKAILNCNEAIKLEPTSMRAYLYRGSLKYHHKILDGAIEDFSAAIRLDPQHASLAHFNRALCYHAQGKLYMALSDYSVVLLLIECPQYKVLINRGLLYLQLGDFANGLLDFMAAGKVMKNDSAIFQAIGYCYHRLGSLSSAIEAYTEAINLDCKFLGAYIGRGNVYIDYLTPQENDKSRLDYLHALELDPNYLPARVNLAFLLQTEGKFQEAWNELTIVLKVDQWHMSAREARAVISLQMGNLFGALLDINAAIQVKKSALLLTNRGVIHQFMGDVVSAMNDYQEAMRIEPGYSLAHFNTGNILLQQRHFRQAVESYSRALNDGNNVDSVLLNRGIAYVMLRDTETACKDFSEAIQANPFSAHAYFNRGNLYRSTGDYHKAEEDYKEALALLPDDWLTMLYYGETLAQQKQENSAHNMIIKAVETQIL